MLNWQPIDTAPIDKYILVMDKLKAQISKAYAETTDNCRYWQNAETHFALGFYPYYWLCLDGLKALAPIDDPLD